MREMDLILGGFVDARVETLAAEELAQFEALLDADDDVAFRWFSGRSRSRQPMTHRCSGKSRRSTPSGTSGIEGARRRSRPGLHRRVKNRARGPRRRRPDACSPTRRRASTPSSPATSPARWPRRRRDRPPSSCMSRATLTRSAQFREALRFSAPFVEILDLPGWDCQPYDRVSPSAAVASRRMTALARLARSNPPRDSRG